jgi:5-carboxymethyl-2-hydroxymuconate isomerase
MPHIVIEYSGHMDETRDMNEICEALRDTAANSGVFPDISAIRVRAIPCPYWSTTNEPACFAHVTIRLLPGRDTATKKRLTALMLARLDAALPDIGSLSVDTKDIDPATYAKRTL